MFNWWIKLQFRLLDHATMFLLSGVLVGALLALGGSLVMHYLLPYAPDRGTEYTVGYTVFFALLGGFLTGTTRWLFRFTLLIQPARPWRWLIALGLGSLLALIPIFKESIFLHVLLLEGGVILGYSGIAPIIGGLIYLWRARDRGPD